MTATNKRYGRADTKNNKRSNKRSNTLQGCHRSDPLPVLKNGLAYLGVAVAVTFSRDFAQTKSSAEGGVGEASSAQRWKGYAVPHKIVSYRQTV
jgi:hypothetical protein